jgi:hypothetical protein
VLFITESVGRTVSSCWPSEGESSVGPAPPVVPGASGELLLFEQATTPAARHTASANVLKLAKGKFLNFRVEMVRPQVRQYK